MLDGYFAEKLPFAGDLGQTATPKGRYPLHGIYRLDNATSHESAPQPIDDGPCQSSVVWVGHQLGELP